MNLAPIILFVFNRPEHTKKTLESLKKNLLSSSSDLFIFSDGPRNEFDIPNVLMVRNVISNLDGFRSVSIRESKINCGLANSVISGVSEIIRKFDKAIIIEDDLIFSPFFLKYTNEALSRYENDKRIFSIGGFSPPIEMPNALYGDSYLSYRCCTWGWATWRNRWDKVDWAVSDYEDFIANGEAINRFNRGGDDMSQILRLQMNGEISSWGIRWDYAHFKNNGYCFRPAYSIVKSTGNDGSGIHCGITNKFDVLINMQSTFNFPESSDLILDEFVNRRFATFYDGRLRSVSSEGEGMINLLIIKKHAFRVLITRKIKFAYDFLVKFLFRY
jgi:hypothetical protein